MGAADPEIFESRTAPTGIAAGQVHALRWVQTTIPEGVRHNEWGIVSKTDSHANEGEHCASYNQFNAYGRAAAWAGCDEVCDMSFGAVPMPMTAREFDVWCAGPDAQGRRIGMFAVVGDSQYIRTGVRYPGAVEAQYGALVCASGDSPWARWRRAYTARDFVEVGFTAHGAGPEGAAAGAGFALAPGRFQRGFDATAGETPIALILARGQSIALEHTASVTISVDDDYTSLIRIKLLGQTMAAIDYNTGDLYVRGEVRKLP